MIDRRLEWGSGYGRYLALLFLFSLVTAALLLRAVHLHLYDRDFLQQHSDVRSMRVEDIPAHRGKLMDRNGEPLALSIPLQSVWVRPRQLLQGDPEQLSRLAGFFDLTLPQLRQLLRNRRQQDFLFLRRGLDPALVEEILELDLSGLHAQDEFRRYYPTAEVSAHVLGFTNVDDIGQEGIELALEEGLRGEPGSKRVLQDRLGRVIENVERIRRPKIGIDVTLSIDRRLQYLAYRELKKAVQRWQARGGILVLLEPVSGEVLAMVNQPSYNPNARDERVHDYHRNTAATDAFELGSTVKPFVVLAALLSGQYSRDSSIDTSPGYISLAGYTIRDPSNYGVLNLEQIIKKSSNVGISKLALSLPPGLLWEVFRTVGFGIQTGSSFPGENKGQLDHFETWSEPRQGTVAYGYGFSATALQLARAYAVFANGGALPTLTLLKRKRPVQNRQVFPAQWVLQVRDIMEGVVQPTGTGKRAAVAHYRIAGKTGTVHKSSADGYSEDRYLALFAGMAPASRPRLVMVVLIDEPAGQYYGGQVAAPVFARVMAASLRLLNVPPDDFSALSPSLITRIDTRGRPARDPSQG